MTAHLSRREFLAGTAAACVSARAGALGQASAAGSSQALVRTVLGPIEPSQLGATLMHEHAPIVDWSELYETPAADYSGMRARMLEVSERKLRAFHDVLGAGEGPGAIVECTPIRVGRSPSLIQELARRLPVHIIACTGFYCEQWAPQHPWALRLGLEEGGVEQMAKLHIREIEQGMEDPGGHWGERFTKVRAGIIKCSISSYLRPGERRCHEAAAIASLATGCPITTHTSRGGGLQQAELFLKAGVKPEKVIIGHQGYLDDRQNEEATQFHRRIADLGSYVQFDLIGRPGCPVAMAARMIRALVEAGFAERVLVGRDLAPFVYMRYAETEKPASGWKEYPADYTMIPTQLGPELRRQGMSDEVVRLILIDNPSRVLPF